MIHVTVGSVPSGSIHIGMIGGQRVYIGTSTWEQSRTLQMFQSIRNMPQSEMDKIQRAIEQKFAKVQNA